MVLIQYLGCLYVFMLINPMEGCLHYLATKTEAHTSQLFTGDQTGDVSTEENTATSLQPAATFTVKWVDIV